MISDNRIRCPQCGSRDVIKPRVHSGGATEPAKTPVSHYLCLLCNNHFSKSSEDDKKRG